MKIFLKVFLTFLNRLYIRRFLAHSWILKAGIPGFEPGSPASKAGRMIHATLYALFRKQEDTHSDFNLRLAETFKSSKRIKPGIVNYAA